MCELLHQVGVLEVLCVCNSVFMLVDVLCHIVAHCYVICALCATWGALSFSNSLIALPGKMYSTYYV